MRLAIRHQFVRQKKLLILFSRKSRVGMLMKSNVEERLIYLFLSERTKMVVWVNVNAKMHFRKTDNSSSFWVNFINKMANSTKANAIGK